jgi:hypothetical protein
VLSVRPRINDLAFRLFAQEVHPELFQVCASRTIEREQYTLELNITTDGHAIRFRHKGSVLTEVCAGAHHPLPESRRLLSLPIEGNCQNQLLVDSRIDYQSEIQIEVVKPALFVAVQQQLDQPSECQGLVHRFGSNGRLKFGAISFLHVQSFLGHVLVRAIHTFPESSVVLTAATRFSVD